jgi:prephenate dehydratase
MVRPDVSLDGITKIIAHPKALGACKAHVASMGTATVNSQSNGEAVRCVAENAECATFAALGPKSAARKYGLNILDEAFEDTEAVTTFFLLAPKDHLVCMGETNRALIVFKVPHVPGALVKALQPFGVEGLNMIQIHSVHAGNCTYNFAIEIEVSRGNIKLYEKAIGAFKENVEAHLCFGPFEVVGR